MQNRTLGRTGLEVSALGFGCGAIGGLMVRGAAGDQERAVALAIARGITYFDTAPQYGDGQSERNLGRVLNALKADVRVGTKVRLKPADWADIAGAVAASVDASLDRLGRASVDLIQLHNRIGTRDEGDMLSVATVLDQVVPALARAKASGKARHIGFTALGETAALHEVVRSGSFETAQIVLNALNPSAVAPLVPGVAAQDYDRLMTEAHNRGMDTIAIRILAGGALSGSEARHPVAKADVDPIGSAPTYAADVARSRRLAPLAAAAGAASTAALAIRFAASVPDVSTALIGVASVDQLEQALDAIDRGPLAADIMTDIRAFGV